MPAKILIARGLVATTVLFHATALGIVFNPVLRLTAQLETRFRPVTWLVHLDSAQSEKIIPYGHGGYQSPESIAELLRILRLHLGLKAERPHMITVSQ